MFKRAVIYFDPFDQVGRYGANAKFDPLSSKTEVFESKGVSGFGPDYINHLDYVASICRSYIKAEPIFNDLISQIKSRNKKASIWKRWQIEGLTPDDILLTENEYI